jgi:hypothetical protein
MGYYKCPRCGGDQAYSSEENGRTFAMTLDTPGPVDPTLFHTMKQTVSRCKNCGEKTQYIMSEADKAQERKAAYKVFRIISLVVLLSIPILAWAVPYLT